MAHINEKTTLSLSLLIALMVITVGGAIKGAQWATKVDAKMDARAESDVRATEERHLLRKELERMTATRWTQNDASRFHDRVRQMNPDLTIPRIEKWGEGQ